MYLRFNLEYEERSVIYRYCRTTKKSIVGPNYYKVVIFMCCFRFFTGLAFYTFSQYLGLIGDNIFQTVALSGLISLPGGLLCVYVVMKAGRKTTLYIFEGTTALCFIGIWMLPENCNNCDWYKLLFAGTGFAGMAVSLFIF